MVTGAIELGARICLVAMFPLSAADKVWHWRTSLRQCADSGLPGPVPILVAAILVEGLTPIAIVAVVWERPAAMLLAAFCVVTAFLYHPFWRVGRDHFWQFVKNFGLVGGLLLVALTGTGPPRW